MIHELCEQKIGKCIRAHQHGSLTHDPSTYGLLETNVNGNIHSNKYDQITLRWIHEILKEEVFYMCIVRAGCIRTWSNLQIAGEDDLTVSTIVGGINLHLDPSN